MSITSSGSRWINGAFEFCLCSRRIKTFDCGGSALPERLKWNSRRLGGRRERRGIRALAYTRSTYGHCACHGGAEVLLRLARASGGRLVCCSCSIAYSVIGANSMYTRILRMWTTPTPIWLPGNLSQSVSFAQCNGASIRTVQKAYLRLT